MTPEKAALQPNNDQVPNTQFSNSKPNEKTRRI